MLRSDKAPIICVLFLLAASNDVASGDDPLLVTPLINSNRSKEAVQKARCPDVDKVENYAGFITVNSTTDTNLFFWFLKSTVHWDESPLVVVLGAEMGASSAYQLLEDTGTGPFHVRYRGRSRNGPHSEELEAEGDFNAERDENTSDDSEPEIDPDEKDLVTSNGRRQRPQSRWPNVLRLRRKSWGTHNNLLFLDSAPGMGYSFTTASEGYVTNLEDAALYVHTALVQFYALFPALLENQLILVGTDFSARIALTAAYRIYRTEDDASGENLDYDYVPVPSKVIFAGGWIDPLQFTKHADTLYAHGLLDKKRLTKFQEVETQIAQEIKAGNLTAAAQKWRQELEDAHHEIGFGTPEDYPESRSNIARMIAKDFLNDTETRANLHVGNRPFEDKGEKLLQHLDGQDMVSIRPMVEEILKIEPFHIYFIHGQLDLISSYNKAREDFAALEWPKAEEYREGKRCRVRGKRKKTFAYYKTAGVFTEILIRGVGHHIAVADPRQRDYVTPIMNSILNPKKVGLLECRKREHSNLPKPVRVGAASSEVSTEAPTNSSLPGSRRGRRRRGRRGRNRQRNRQRNDRSDESESVPRASGVRRLANLINPIRRELPAPVIHINSNFLHPRVARSLEESENEQESAERLTEAPVDATCDPDATSAVPPPEDATRALPTDWIVQIPDTPETVDA